MSAAKTSAIHGTWVLALEHGAPRLLADRWVVTEGNTIAAISRSRPSQADVVIDRPGLLVLPGLINMHNHCFSELLVRGRTEDLDGRSYVTTLIYGLLLPLQQLAIEKLSGADLRAVIELGLLQVIKGGSTTLMESFRNGLADIFDVARRMGLRFYGAPYVFSTARIDIGADGQPTYAGGDGDGAADLQRWEELFRAQDGAAGGRIHVVLGPHGADTCGPDLLRAVRGKAGDRGCLITTHLAQSESELATLQQRYNRSPAEYLDWVGLLGPDLSAAHCIYASEADLEMLRGTDTTIISCPRTFSRGGVTAPFYRFRAHGIRTAIGTDGYNMDLVSEIGAAGMVSKLHSRDSGVARAGELVNAVTLDAAAALRRTDIGRLEKGARADLVAIDLAKPHMQPVSDPLRAFVWRASGRDVESTMVDGEFLVADGRYQLGDEAAITAAGVAAIEKVWQLPAAEEIFRRADRGSVSGGRRPRVPASRA